MIKLLNKLTKQIEEADEKLKGISEIVKKRQQIYEDIKLWAEMSVIIINSEKSDRISKQLMIDRFKSLLILFEEYR